MKIIPGLLFVLLCMVTTSLSVVGQTLLYTQVATGGNGRTSWYPIKFDEHSFITFITSGGLYSVRMDRIDVELLNVEVAKTAAYCDYEYSGDAICGYTSNFTPAMFTLHRDLSADRIDLDEHTIREDRPAMSENSPWGYRTTLTLDSILISSNLGASWNLVACDGTKTVPASNSNCLYIGGTKRMMLFKSEGGELTQRLLPFVNNGIVQTVAHVSNDSLYWVEGQDQMHLFKGALDSKGAMRIDSVQIEGVVTHLAPFAILGLADSTALYLDQAGWTAIVRAGRFHSSPIMFQRRTSEGAPQVIQPRGGYAYVVRQSRPNRVLYQLALSSPPRIDSIVLPEGVSQLYAHRNKSKLYEIGHMIEETETIQYLVSFVERETIVTGSLLNGINALGARPMAYTWFDKTHKPFALTSLEQIVEIDSNRRGLLRRGKVQSSSYAAFTSETESNYPNLNFREWGLSVPALMAGGLVFAGPVVRRISLDGRSTDTLYGAPNSFASVLPDGRLASGWMNALRLHGATSTDTASITIPVGAIADSMGYPTAMVQCANGHLLTSFNGTWRKDSSAEGKRLFRWGGILRSTDDGGSWLPLPLADPESNYVMHIARTHTGTLLATCMRMIEDTSVAFTAGYQTMETTYKANRITILRSVDCGESWTEVHTPFYNGPWQMNAGNIVQQSDGRLFAALIPGVYTSTDDGRTWQLDERVNALIVPVSLTLNDDESLLLSANDGVYRLDKLTGVEEESGLSERVRMEVLTPSALLQRLSTGKVEHASVVDLQGRETVLVSGGSVVHAASPLHIHGVYGLVVNGERRVVCVREE